MKTIRQSLLLIITLLLAFGGFSQGTTNPATTNAIVHTNLANDPDINVDSTMFEVVPLTPSDPDAWFMHFWWAGDNGFSFAPKPKYNHQVQVGSQARITAITTENYGTGGPPPLTYTFTTEHEGTELPKVLGVDTFLYAQMYRNAVIHDTMYLVVSYGNSQGGILSGKLKIDVGRHAEVCDQMIVHNRSHFFPNEETWDSAKDELTFMDLGSAEERSILIPVYIHDNEEDLLDMNVYLFHGISEEYPNPNGEHQYSVSPPVAQSHDPNMMIAESNAKNKCDYRGGKIHYTVKFQNDGGARTHYVRVVCRLDDKVDLESIKDVKVPEKFYRFCTKNDTIRKQYEKDCGAIWSVDPDTRILTIEMHDIVLYSSMDPHLPRIDMAQGEVEFDIQVKSDYVFGEPIVAYSEIFFDSQAAVVTNSVEVGCKKPIPDNLGGGFQGKTKGFVCIWFWWILAILLFVILVLSILLARDKRKQRNLQKG